MSSVLEAPETVESVVLDVNLDDVPKCEVEHRPNPGVCTVEAVVVARSCAGPVLGCAFAAQWWAAHLKLTDDPIAQVVHARFVQ